MALALVATILLVTILGVVAFGAWAVMILVGWVRHRLEDRACLADPFVPSRVYIDERYGGADADSSRCTGFLGPTSHQAYLHRLREASSRTAWSGWIP